MARKTGMAPAAKVKGNFTTSTSASAYRSRVPGKIADPERSQNKNRYKNFSTVGKTIRKARGK